MNQKFNLFTIKLLRKKVKAVTQNTPGLTKFLLSNTGCTSNKGYTDQQISMRKKTTPHVYQKSLLLFDALASTYLQQAILSHTTPLPDLTKISVRNNVLNINYLTYINVYILIQKASITTKVILAF